MPMPRTQPGTATGAGHAPVSPATTRITGALISDAEIAAIMAAFERMTPVALRNALWAA